MPSSQTQIHTLQCNNLCSKYFVLGIASLFFVAMNITITKILVIKDATYRSVKL